MFDSSKVRDKMQSVVETVSTDVGSIRTGRATTSLIAEKEVSVYGGQQRLKINELATVTSPDPQSLVIDPWDKSIVGEIKKGIEAANIGLTPSIDGELIRISVPTLTTEDRERFVKLLATKIENGKVAVRQVRGDVMQEIKEDYEKKEIGEDEKFRQEAELQKLTDEFNGKLEKVEEKKKGELLQV